MSSVSVDKYEKNISKGFNHHTLTAKHQTINSKPSICPIIGFKTQPKPHSNRERMVNALQELVKRQDKL